jgi:hypothetical protein
MLKKQSKYGHISVGKIKLNKDRTLNFTISFTEDEEENEICYENAVRYIINKIPNLNLCHSQKKL